MSNFPVPITNPETFIPKQSPNTKLNVGGIWGQITGGQTVLGSDGKRFIWSANNVAVVYSIGGRFFIQSSQGFINEMRTAPAIEGMRRAEFMVRCVEVEMRFLMGIVAGASGVGFAAVVGTEIAAFVMENRNNFTKWSRYLNAFLQAREILKSKAPKLYDKVFNAILSQVWKDWKSKLTGAVTAEIIAFGVGVILGSAGKYVAEGTFSLLKVGFVVLEQIAIRFSLGVAPGAAVLSAQDYKKLADSLISTLRSAGVALNEPDVAAIVAEVKQHPDDIKRALQILKVAYAQQKE